MPRLNVQADLRSYLEEGLPGVPVKVAVPKEFSGELVVVRRDGGGRENALVDSAGVGIQMWADTEAEAAELAERVGDLMQAAPFVRGYARVTEESMRSDYDLYRSRPRWYASYTIKTYKPKE